MHRQHMRGRTRPAALQIVVEALREVELPLLQAPVHLLAERFKCAQRVGHLKATAGLPPADPAREREQIARLRALAEESHLDPAFAESFLAFIVAEVIHHHERIAEDAARG